MCVCMPAQLQTRPSGQSATATTTTKKAHWAGHGEMAGRSE